MINLAYEEFARQNGYSYTCMQLMHLIYNNPGCTQKMLNERTRLPKQTINAVISNLYKGGMIELRENPTDRRSKSIFYCEKEKEMICVLFEKTKEAVYRSMDGLTAEERLILIRAMEKFAEKMRENFQK